MELNIVVDGVAVPARADANLLETCLAAGLDVPYFCWHKALGSVGSCRQCAVKTFRGPGDDAGQIVMACMTPVTAGMRVSIVDKQAAAFRESVVELVLTNHPHDCPVCEVGGECHLQDMTALTGHTTRRDRFAKRTHLNQDLGPFIKHEMNRCIGCYRCVRFYRDYAGGEDFGVFGANRNIYFGRAADGALESEFAGNLVEVCPTGVFVDKPFSAVFRRKWDMRATPSVCPHCPVGCNITVQERGGKFRRVVNRYNATLNGFFLCDRGRFGTGFVESERRLRQSRNRAGLLTHEAAREALANVLRQERMIGVGSPRASVEANFALRQVVGAQNFYAGVSDYDAAVMDAAAAAMRVAPVATLQDAERADAILLLGDDPLAVAPRLALALRQAALRPPSDLLAERQIPAWHDGAARTAAGRRITVIIASSAPTWLDDVASLTVRDTPEAIAKLAFAAADGADDLANPLRNAKAPVVVVGGSAALVLGAANIVLALRRTGVAARLCVLLPEANSMGLALMKARPLRDALPVIRDADVVVLENDIFGRDAGMEIGAAAKRLVDLDHIETPAVAAADLAVAVASFADADGTFVNMEGRAQSFYKVIFGKDDPPASWAALRDAGIAAGLLPEGSWATHGALLDALAAEIPALALCKAAPAAGGEQIPTLPHRFSGRTAMDAQFDVREPAPAAHFDSPLGTTMEGAPQTSLAPLVWAPGWNSGQVVNKQPGSAPDVFLFEDRLPDAPFFAMPPLPWPERPPAGPEELSALSPAIIARRGA